MKKKASSISKKYLKILGWINVVLAILGIFSLIIMACSNIELSTIVDANTLDQLHSQNLSDDVVLASVVIAGLIGCAIDIIIGWLMIRASEHPEKTTAILVLTVLSLVSNIVTILSSGFNDFSVIMNNILPTTIDILTLMAIMRVRREIDA